MKYKGTQISSQPEEVQRVTQLISADYHAIPLNASMLLQKN